MRKYDPKRRNLARRETVDVSVPPGGGAKSERVNLGLSLLSRVAVRGVEYDLDEIAIWCGCTENAIHSIQQRALKRLRNKLRYQNDPVLRELAEVFR